MKIALYIIAFVVLCVAAFAIWVRLAQSDPAHWHVDPTTAKRPGTNGWLIRADRGDAVPAPIDAAPAEVLQAFDAIATSTPRTRRLSGSPQEGRITYVTRSAVWGFPDYTTVAATDTPDGTVLTVLGRARFGRSDFGVNRARIEGWTDALRRRLDQP